MFLNPNIAAITQHMILKFLNSYKTKYVLFNKIKIFNLNDIIITKTALKVGVS